jgi:hypothetical protein
LAGGHVPQPGGAVFRGRQHQCAVGAEGRGVGFSCLNSGTGTLPKAAGSGTATINAFINTACRVENQVGTLCLELTPNATDTDGTFDVAEGALVDLASAGTAGNPPVFTGTFTGSGADEADAAVEGCRPGSFPPALWRAWPCRRCRPR